MALRPPDIEPPATVRAAEKVAASPWQPPAGGHGLFKALLLRMPLEVRRSLDHEQLMALRQAAEELSWGGHKLDIRCSLPTPFGRYYAVLVGGRERRHADPLRAGPGERRAIRFGNTLSLVVLGVVLAGLGAFLGLVLLAIAYG